LPSNAVPLPKASVTRTAVAGDGCPICIRATAMYYEISGTKVRLAGSMHHVPAGAPIPLWIEQAYRWSEDLYLEENKDEAQGHTLLPLGESSEQRVPAELWAKIKTAWPASQGVLGRQKLWLIATSLGFSGVPSQHGVEHLITERAKADSRTIRYLETGAEFSQLMDGTADIEYHKAFAVILRSDAQSRAQSISDMYWAWMSGRVDRLMETLQRSPMAQFPLLREMIFDRRNWLWLPRIVAILVTPRPTVIFVGAGHLGGPDGILALLRRAGFNSTHLV
jgi:uncharacterized protein